MPWAGFESTIPVLAPPRIERTGIDLPEPCFVNIVGFHVALIRNTLGCQWPSLKLHSLPPTDRSKGATIHPPLRAIRWTGYNISRRPQLRELPTKFNLIHQFTSHVNLKKLSSLSTYGLLIRTFSIKTACAFLASSTYMTYPNSSEFYVVPLKLH
jgi:hypothetical protein